VICTFAVLAGGWAVSLALRPYPALERFRDAMYSSLKDKVPPDGWDYPTPESDSGWRAGVPLLY